MKHQPKGPYEKYFKRLIDIICSLLAIILLSWVYIIVAILVRIKLGSPVLFTQDRPGKDEKKFKMYKFRSMTSERDENGNLLPDDVRLTKFGKWLRSTSLDELPELFNILKGDMSLIGPRPLLVQYLPLYNEKQKRRHEVTPGLSGLAQVNGRNNVLWNEKLAMDIWYVNHVSLKIDIHVIINTIKSVILRDSIEVAGVEPLTAFRMNK